MPGDTRNSIGSVSSISCVGLRMRTGVLSLAASAATALLFVSLGILPVRQAVTEEVRPIPPPCTCPSPQQTPRVNPSLNPRPKFAGRHLDESDEVAALEAVSVALAQVGDGTSFVWHRGNGRLSGTVQPTSSFKDAAGRVCRHVIVSLASETRSGRLE